MPDSTKPAEIGPVPDDLFVLMHPTADGWYVCGEAFGQPTYSHEAFEGFPALVFSGAGSEYVRIHNKNHGFRRVPLSVALNARNG
jgi:hypothetical protein